ncbi:hypothetical protein [Mucilaginibacter flavidus]|uniref:hypothetical protein n=1 Tax=Mucilaginibacter flavidus TaxID=2949309 RepID=UPI00209342DF|nr:hypothetical protein [Mucilaginibacter flavidus]MCO5946239.1 hypothetical protein [Mucilaginibacter flavidus]
MLIPEEVFKRRKQHNNTPESIMLIIVNFIVVSLAETLFWDHTHINWFFWVAIGLLAVYNFFSLRKNLEVYSKIDKIVYVSSMITLAILAAVLFIFQ